MPTSDLRGEYDHARTRIRLFQDEYRAASASARRSELEKEMRAAARESAALMRRMEAARLVTLLGASAAGGVEARYAFDVAAADPETGVDVATYTDGPRGPDGAVVTVAELRARGDARRACEERLAAQIRDLDRDRSERRRHLIEAHGRERANGIRDEMRAFLEEMRAR